MKGRSRGWLIFGAVILGALLIALIPSKDDDGVGIDSTGPEGHKAFADLLDSYGVKVIEMQTSEIRRASSDTILFAPLGISEEVSRDAVLEHARKGGVAVVVTPDEELGFTSTRGSFGDRVLRAECTMEGLEGVEEINANGSLIDYESIGNSYCFTARDEEGVALLVERRVGGGSVIGIGVSSVFSNRAMGIPEPEEQETHVLDNPVLAVRLFGRASQVAFLDEDQLAIGGQRTWTDMLPMGVQLSIAQLFAIGAMYVWFRGHRDSRIVEEPLSVITPGAALTSAMATLMDRVGDDAHALQTLQRDACERIGTALHLGPYASFEEVVNAAARRSHYSPQDIAALLGAPARSGDFESTAFAIHDLVQEISNV